MNIIYYLLTRFFSKHKKHVFIILILSLINSIIQVNVLSFITAKIIQSLQGGIFSNAIYFFKIFIFISILYIIITYLYKNVQMRLIAKLRHWIKEELLQIILEINNYKYITTNFAKLVSPMNKIAGCSYLIINNLLSFLLPNIALLFVIVFFFFYKSNSFGIMFIITNILLLLYIRRIWNQLYTFSNNYETIQNKTEDYILEIINNADKVIHTGQSNIEIEKIHKYSDDAVDAGYRLYNASNTKGLYSNIILHTNIFIYCGYLLYLVMNKHISLTIFITFFTIIIIYKERFLWSINTIPDLLEYIGR